MAITAGVNKGQPWFSATGWAVEGHGFADFEKAGDVFGPLHISIDPVQRVGNPAQHFTASRCSLTTHVSLQPPPWEEFTTSEPRFNATRVKPPGLTQLLLPRST